MQYIPSCLPSILPLQQQKSTIKIKNADNPKASITTLNPHLHPQYSDRLSYVESSSAAELIYNQNSRQQWQREEPLQGQIQRETERRSKYEKDFATIQRENRDKIIRNKSQMLERKKLENIGRERRILDNYEQNSRKILQKQRISYERYSNGQLKSTLSNSIPVNPVNSQYLQNKRGQSLALKDEQRNLNKIIRAHYLHTVGNSGYNIITGKCSIDLQKRIPQQKHEIFQQKINQLYSRYRLNPENK